MELGPCVLARPALGRSPSRSPRARATLPAAPRPPARAATRSLTRRSRQLLRRQVHPGDEVRPGAARAGASRPSGGTPRAVQARPIGRSARSLSAIGMNFVGRPRPRGRRGPAQERLDADDRCASRGRSPAGSGRVSSPRWRATPQLVLEPEHLAELAGHVVPEDLTGAAPGLLRRVHGDVRVADQAPRALAGAARVNDDADARRHHELAVRHRDAARGGARAAARRPPRPGSRWRPRAGCANSSPPRRARVSLGASDSSQAALATSRAAGRRRRGRGCRSPA